MSYNVVANNLLAMNAERMLGLNSKSKAKNMEKLSSGYRINRAADDAAGLSMSETMRRMIRGLNQGTENAHDGVSWVQTGDGALEEVDAMLHRMTELTIKSLNGTWTDQDRAMMQAEFQQLQKEIDRLTDAATFNEKHIFAEHDLPYYQFTGNVQWLPSQKHTIVDGSNSLSITYTRGDGSPTQTATITVPPGRYTTKELIDEIDTALEEAGLKDEGFSLEFTENNTCNLNYDGGAFINSVDGGLSYLLYDVFEGGSAGALIGTTKFRSDDATLRIVEGVNDYMEFDIESLDGTTRHIELTIPPKEEKPFGYTRDELIGILNEKLADTSVRAVKYGQGIKLESDDSIITALKGNMFKIDYIDRDGDIYTSVFYDNISYGDVNPYQARFIGGTVLTRDVTDEEHSHYNITSDNNVLLVQPNGSPNVTRLEIEPGYYTAEEMMRKLNDLFTANGLGLTASVNDTEKDFLGLIIESTVKGLESDVGIDTSSSAYNTLFIRRAYKVEEEAAIVYKDLKDDEYASYRGGKTFGTVDYPLTINRGVNDRFNIILDGKTYTITLENKAYQSIGQIRDAINKAIKEAADKLEDEAERALLSSVVASYSSSNAIVLTAQSDAYSIVASKVSGNTGFEEIFTTRITYTTSKSSPSKNGSTILNTEIDLPATIPSDKRRLQVVIEEPKPPYSCTVELEDRVYESYEDILKEINSKLPGAGTDKVSITFSPNPASASGSGRDREFSGSGTTTPPAKKEYKGKGTGDPQGQLGGDVKPTPAEVNIPIAVSFPYEITKNNNSFYISINGIPKTVTLETGRCEKPSDLAKKLEDAINKEFGQGSNGVDVKASGSNITISTKLSGNVSISCEIVGDDFLKDVTTRKSAAMCSIPINVPVSITKGVNDIFSFEYIEGGKPQIISITIPPGDYTSRDNIAKAINDQLIDKKIDVKAEASGNYLVLTANTPGDGYGIVYRSTAGGTSAESLVTDVEKKPAVTIIGADIQEPPITIDGNSNEFTLSVNGKSYTAIIPSKTYNSREDFIDALDKALKAAGAGVSAALDGNKIKLTTDATGSSARISVTYNKGGKSSMEAIFGTKDVEHKGLKASFSEDHHLILTAINEDGSTATGATLSVSSTYGSIFQLGNVTSSAPVNGTASIAYHSNVHSVLYGAKLREPIMIDQWNNTFNFTYHDGSSSHQVSISLDFPKDYTFDELKAELQKKLDANTYTQGAFNVDVTPDGVKITSIKPGNSHYIGVNERSGGFYYNVLCRAGVTSHDTTAVRVKGGYDSVVFAVGRKDVRNKTTTITKGVNDTLSLWFTYGGIEKKFEMTLDPGNYTASELVKQVQKKLNEQLVANGLNPNLIEVQIGGINTGVEGNNDNNALVFRLSEHVELPDENAEYKIDGIGGTAAFSIFYQTDGDIMVAYISGTKDVSKGVTIPADSELSFDVDGEHYSITVPKGNYSPQGILDKLNELLKAEGAPVAAKISDGVLQLSMTKYGTHKITNVAGDARRYLFFEEEGAIEGEKDIWLRVGSESGDGVEIERPVVNTVSLGLNSLIITKPKYAEKALNRIKSALSKVSDVRTNFGVKQNRLDHTINKNNNTSENMQAAESAIRDADVSKEMMEFAINNILENAGISMLAQANSSKSYLLSLLQ